MRYISSGCVLLSIFIVLSTAQDEDNSTTTPKIPTTTPGTTISPAKECMMNNKSCGDCLKFSHCLWCYEHNTCKPYPVGHILPRTGDCPLSQARWGTCIVNFEALLIAMGVIGGVLLVSTCCCVYCCCCRTKGANKKLIADEAKWERQKEERKDKADERRQDRKSKTDDIRRKYGLMKDDNPYQRFEA